MEWPIRTSFPASAEKAPRGLLRRILDRILYVRPSEREVSYRETPQPYNFIAQIAFKEMTAAGAKDMELPDSGALYLFYDDLSQCWGFDPRDSVGFKVIYAPDIDGAATAQKPDFFDEVPSYKEVFVEPALRFEQSPAEGVHFEKMPISEADKEAYLQFDELVEDQTQLGWPSLPAHKVRGWSNIVQNPMEEECALVTSGIYCGDSEGYDSPEAKRIMAEPNDWVQLLQIDSDDNTGMMWGDAGMLYLWIRMSDLKQRNFSNTWLILQCG